MSSEVAGSVYVGSGKLPSTWKTIRRAQDGAAYRRSDGLQVILSVADEEDGRGWIHLSVSRRSRVPSYDDLVAVKHLFIGDNRWAYQVFPPKDRHVNIHKNCLHLWSLVSEEPALPDFARGGMSI